jgi:redox-sensitive bicupin YhaK (pirin superfamily)
VIRIRRTDERGRTRLPWLDGRHSFSFGNYYDPENMGFRSLRVINDDVIAPRGGFGTHPHQDMEIVTVVLSGALRHQDSMGNGSVIRPGDVQRMTAGTGVRHSEHNDSDTEPAHLLQIWLLPESRGLEPSYEQTTFNTEARAGEWVVVASRDGRDGSVTIHQDAALHRLHLPPNATVGMPIRADRHGWLHVVDGVVQIGGETLLAGKTLVAGDGVAMSAIDEATLVGVESADLLFFDLA